MLENIRLLWQGMSEAYILAHYVTVTITAVKSFIVQAADIIYDHHNDKNVYRGQCYKTFLRTSLMSIHIKLERLSLPP